MTDPTRLWKPVPLPFSYRLFILVTRPISTIIISVTFFPHVQNRIKRVIISTLAMGQNGCLLSLICCLDGWLFGWLKKRGEVPEWTKTNHPSINIIIKFNQFLVRCFISFALFPFYYANIGWHLSRCLKSHLAEHLFNNCEINEQQRN